ncbi:LytR/AlgR family response regulator transcription factor [Robertkochia solimangrovi]|uniref:LytR/AlgR family response regulator transcription factor n=1 Tax=Robertkochia solimangrovi TaxID=2213046 RepID=UPI00117EEB13|nr:LytTR family DNA-binding domain-containing protein [Robertkochia solimangrovi]TRZ46243.1 DNA-binding response regulator [Robertkochia solimangrovi]
MIKALIIDDEIHCIEELQLLLKSFGNTVQVAGFAQTVGEGIDLIGKVQPDLIFLDIQIGDSTGFELIERVSLGSMNVIFTTAYDTYALQAFRFSALDYLLKPIETESLKRALDKHEREISSKYLEQKLDILMHNLTRVNSNKRITIPTSEGYEFVEISGIIRCQADVNYTDIYLDSGKKITVSKTLKSFEEMLVDEQFFRVHYSHLINLKKIKKYVKGKGGYVIMEDKSIIEVSTRRKEEFLAQLKELY